MNMNSSIGELNGIGPQKEKALQKLGVYTIGDMLLAFPRDYKQIPAITPVGQIYGEKEYAIRVQVVGTPLVKSTRSMQIVTAKFADATGTIRAVWFRMPYIRNQLEKMHDVVLFGKVKLKNKSYEMEQPMLLTYEAYEQMLSNLQPVYTLGGAMSGRQFAKFVRLALEQVTEEIEFLPKDIIERNHLMSYREAIRIMHFPQKLELLTEARQRIAFNEFFLFMLTMQRFKNASARIPNHFPLKKDEFADDLIAQLPFTLTGAQKRVLNELQHDMEGTYTMQRLVQGDVGSGKTILAFLMMVQAAHAGYQSAIMAPTEVLAQQHYDTFTTWIEQFGLDFPVVLLTGSLTAKQKREAYARIEQEPDILIVGTHALIQEKVKYGNLALVVTDEQHRFGVRQRETFAQKGMNQPHVLVMSATPIPRTLAIILYGDLDISVVDELPAKRQKIKNCVVNDRMRGKSWDFIAEEVRKGHQAYVICPLVEENEELDLKDVISYTQKMHEYYAGEIKVAYLHGKMKNQKKNEIMQAFLKNEIQVLVSTTVIEVGVNVPNATVMMVEDAQRFGLAQLHQLRGRVGRGEAQSYCIMMNTSDSAHAKERLEILNHSNDGFYIAGEDLKMRGPGDFFGIRQSGVMEFKVADIFYDADMLALASKEAKEYAGNDAHLEEMLHTESENAYLHINI